MPIGPIIPGSYCTVTPDPSPPLYTLLQAPTATMGVSADHLQVLTLAILNVQKALDKAKAGVEVFQFLYNTPGLSTSIPIETFVGPGAAFASVTKVAVTGCTPGDIITADVTCEIIGIELSGGSLSSGPALVSLAIKAPGDTDGTIIEGGQLIDSAGRHRIAITGAFTVAASGTMTVGIEANLTDHTKIIVVSALAVRAVRVRKG